jgi:DNA-binding PucR family transcriptional regulator
MDLRPIHLHLGAVPPRSPRCEALMARVASEMDPHTDAIAELLVERIAAEMDLIRDDEDVREDLLATARATAALLTAMVRSWTDPHVVPAPREAVWWAQTLVARGLSIDAVLRVYHIGQSGYHEVWYRQLLASGEDLEIVLEALNALSAFAFTFVDAISAPLVEAYQRELERTMRGVDAVRTEAAEAVLGGGPLNVPAVGARLGYDLERPHLAYVAWVETDAGDDARDALEGVTREVAQALARGRVRGARGEQGAAPAARPLLLRVAPRLVFAWVARGSLAPKQLEAVRALLEGTDVHVAVGRPAPGVVGFRRSHEQARRARRVARLLRRSPALTCYEDVAVADLLTRDPDAAREVALATLGPLAAGDRSSRRLLETLSVYLQEGQSYARTARRLGIHENTVAYRVRRALELTAEPDPGSHLLRAAVELAPLLEGHGESPGRRDLDDDAELGGSAPAA